MSKIKCIENYKELREMLLKGEKGNAKYFSHRLNISNRTFRRLIKYLREIEKINVKYNKTTKNYSYKQ